MAYGEPWGCCQKTWLSIPYPTLRTKGLGELPFRVASVNSSKLTDSPNGKMLTECPERYLHVGIFEGDIF